MLILCGDIGGTKTRLALFEHSDKSLTPITEIEYASQEYASFDKLVYEFMNSLEVQPDHACFGIAGPITGNAVATTNLPWTIDATQLEAKLNVKTISLLNDLEATAWGIPYLQKDEILTLQSGSPDPYGNRTIIAAGTGLGQAGMVWNGKQHIPFASEGGHSDFAPGNREESELLLQLTTDGNQVCWEDILSGPGLVKIYRYILSTSETPAPEWISNQNAAAKISELATSGLDGNCVRAMQIFARLYGAEAGNQALKLMARGGVYIGGGIAPKILPWLKRPEFLYAFNHKGKMQELMESMPVYVILNDRAALYGPAIYIRETILQN